MIPVSIYIPCYNVERFIGLCIEHLLQQTHLPDEILIINDGSNDNTVKITQQYPVRIIHQDYNRGLAITRNTGVQNAKNELVASIDADCIADKYWLEELVKEINQPDIAGVGGKLIEKYNHRITDRWRASHMRQHWWDEIKINPMFLFGHSNIFKKSILEKVGCYNSKYRTNYEDVDISHRIMNEGYRLVYTPSAIVYHLRQDTVYSLLKAYWRWTLFDKVEPTSWSKMITKWRFNLGKSWHFIKTDLQEGKKDLALLDAIMFPYHCIFDWQYFSNHVIEGKD